MNNIFVVVNGEKYGPYTKETIANFVKEGRVNGETPCWYEGLPQWIPLKTAFPDLFPQTPLPPPVANYNPPQTQQQKSGKGCCFGCFVFLLAFLIVTAVAGFFMWKYGKVYIENFKYKYIYQYNSLLIDKSSFSKETTSLFYG